MLSTGGTTQIGLYDFKVGADEFGKVDYWVAKSGGYPINKRVMLSNGDIVRNTAPENTNNPNVDTTGWVKVDSIIVESVADMLALDAHDGMIVKTLGYHPATNFALAKPYKGGGTFVYKSLLSNKNDHGLCINGWVRQFNVNQITVDMFGAVSDYDTTTKIGTDDTLAFQHAVAACLDNKIRKIIVPVGNYLVTDTINLGGINSQTRDAVCIEGEHSLKSNIVFKAAYQKHPLFRMFGISGNVCGHGLRNITMNPFDKLQGIALQIQGADFCVIRDFYINDFYVGVHLYNSSKDIDPIPSGNFLWTEFNRFETGRIAYCQHNVMFEVDGADASFHGNSFVNVQNQMLTTGGSGIYFKGDPNGNTCFAYNNHIDMNFFGIWSSNMTPDSCYLLRLEKATLKHMSGDITCEGRFSIKADAVSSLDWRGNLQFLNDMWWQVENDYPNPTDASMAGINQDWGRLKFSNVSSKGMSNVFISQSDLETPHSTGFQALYSTVIKDPGNIFTNKGYKASELNLDLGRRTTGSSGYPVIFTIYNNNFASVACNTFGSSGTDIPHGFWIGQQKSPWNGGVQNFTPTSVLNGDGSGITVYTSEYSISLKGLGGTGTNAVSVDNTALFSKVGGSLALGKTSNRWSALRVTGWDVASSNITPTVTATSNIGSSSLTVNNIYAQNAVTVVSDERYKTDISELTEIELQCAIACSKLYRKYKLNAAVDEKGINAARYHIGVIAQEVVQCFIDHDLDWRKYGIITYEKWDSVEAVEYQPAVYAENGDLLQHEVQAVDAKEAGEIYMVRYDELNCFINAGLEYRLSKLEMGGV